jgi:Mrp family chromosome partitioning ATPase
VHEFVGAALADQHASTVSQDWRWPRVVDELIATQWALVNQLGRSALASSLNDVQRILVTGPRRGVGKTSIALTLARWAALARQRVLLVDADFGQPDLADRVGVEVLEDWRSSKSTRRLLKHLSLEQLGPRPRSPSAVAAMSRDAAEHLVHCASLPISLLPLAKTPTPDSHMRSAMEQLIALLSIVELEFDCCILDCGPVTDLVDQIDEIRRIATSTVVVNSMNTVDQSQLIVACNEIWRRGNPAITIAENKSTNVCA